MQDNILLNWVTLEASFIDQMSSQILLKITNIIYLQSLLNHVHDFEICPISVYATFDFVSFLKTLTLVKLYWTQLINWLYYP